MAGKSNRPFIEWSNLWTVSNILSMSRVVMLIPIVYYLLQEGVAARWWAFFWIFLAVLTDNLDGRFARARNEITEEGKILDPLADKICVGVVIVVLAWRGEVPLWFFAAVVSRDVIILLSAAYFRKRFGFVPASDMAGKIAVTVIVATLGVMILPFEVPALLLAAMTAASVAVIVVSLLSYSRTLIDQMRMDQKS
jgi:CDP-diacylglycerol--glycerol-3-phosphate 3-phosphatidyltransferase